MLRCAARSCIHPLRCLLVSFAGSITREITALVNGKSCPQLTSYYGSVVVGTKLWIAMEFLDGGSVLDKVRSEPEPLLPLLSCLSRLDSFRSRKRR